jgi:hypothetical protein
MPKKTLVVRAEGATADVIAQGVAAAQRVFDDAGVTPWQAAIAWFNRDGWDIKNFPEPAPSRETFRHAEVWDDAEAAARDACCTGGNNNSNCEMAVIDDDTLLSP